MTTTGSAKTFSIAPILLLEPLEPRIAPAVILVSNADDSGAGSLRAAIEEANLTANKDRIVFDSNFFTEGGPQIKLTSGEIQIKGPLDIVGLGPGRTVISAEGLSRIFSIDDGTPKDTPVRISGVTLTS